MGYQGKVNMTTNIEDIYKKYPEAKVQVEKNMIQYGNSTYDPEEESCFDSWLRIADCDTELYQFLYILSDYDGFLLKENEITPADYMKNETTIKRLMVENFNANLDEIWWISEDEDDSKWSDFHRNVEGV